MFAMAAYGSGLSGSDRIFIELARRWSKDYPVAIYVWEEGKEMLQRQHLIDNGQWLMIKVLKMGNWCRFGFVVCYFARIIRSVIEAFKLAINHPSLTIAYSASDFWMDSLPGWILKLRFPKITWIGTFYLAAPNPFRGFREEGELKLPGLKGTIYWLAQQPIYWLIRRFADIVFVTSDPDVKRFPEHSEENRVVVVRGGVNLAEIKNQKSNLKNLPKIYDAVFQGRFHPQKGVLELVDIWKRVVDRKPNAKLVMIGDGPLMTEVKSQISNHKLQKNVKLFGYVFDGPKKYRIFQQSKIFIHPVIYDSGGMSAAEGMAWGIPAVSFDLEALKTYYPKGVLKAKIGDLDDYASLVLRLLEDESLYQKTRKEAVQLIEDYWSWDQRADKILKIVKRKLVKYSSS